MELAIRPACLSPSVYTTSMRALPLLAVILLSAGLQAQDKPTPEALERGKVVYMKSCVACHMPTGQGLAPVFPPLDGSEWLQLDNTVLAKIVLRGLQGPIKVKGQDYNGVMAPLADTLKDAEIADVLNYVRATWGKGGPLADEPLVKAAREASKGQKQPYTAAELGVK
jgi:mono/diheme cytochrome c family protein